jgi:hypothetical protein
MRQAAPSKAILLACSWLGLGGGSLRFSRNGAQHGSGYAAGSVTGPVVAAVQLYTHNASVRLLPNAQQPE